MNTLSWNCQGMGLPWKVQFLKDIVTQEKPKFIFLCETISNKTKMEAIRIKLGFEGMFVVEPVGRSGGLVMLWRDSEDISLRSWSHSHIDVEVKTNMA